jgi:hypothetical protein
MELDSVHGIDQFVLMFKLAAAPLAIFIIFFVFVFGVFALSVYLLLGDALQDFSSLADTVSAAALVLAGYEGATIGHFTAPHSRL